MGIIQRPIQRPSGEATACNGVNTFWTYNPNFKGWLINSKKYVPHTSPSRTILGSRWQPRPKEPYSNQHSAEKINKTQ